MEICLKLSSAVISTANLPNITDQSPMGCRSEISDPWPRLAKVHPATEVFLPCTNPSHDKRSYSYMQHIRTPPIQSPSDRRVLQAMDLYEMEDSDYFCWPETHPGEWAW